LFLTAMNRLKSICDDSLLFIVCWLSQELI
jgi:hypothetical protein